jgi:hypothetical protein
MFMRVRKGHTIAVTFLDHVFDDVEPACFCVYGKVVKTRKHYVVVEVWGYADPCAAPDENAHHYTILRSAILTIRQLLVGQYLEH